MCLTSPNPRDLFYDDRGSDRRASESTSARRAPVIATPAQNQQNPVRFFFWGGGIASNFSPRRMRSIDAAYSYLRCTFMGCGVTMGWLLRLVTGAPTGGRGPPTVLEFLVINFSVCLVLLSNCYIIIYCIVWFQVQPLMVVFQ